MSAHGYGAYTHGCRCGVCRRAKADYMAERRRAARTVAQAMTATPNGRRGSRANAWAVGATRYVAPIANHGTRAGYEEHGCRCGGCTEARSASDRKYSRGAK